MSEHWQFLVSGAQEPAFNMAFDEVLLDNAPTFGKPVLRFYGWTEPAATFGYFQRYRDVSAWTALRPLIRRPTGGGLVPHDADWTYSLVFPPNHAWFETRAVESYRRVHEWLQRAFAALGVSSQLASERQSAAPGQCFAGAEKFDLLWGGLKTAGAAQRRTRSGLLIQGSVQPRGCDFPRADWQDAMLQAAPGKISWTRFDAETPLNDRARELAAQKYSQLGYNERR